MTPGSRNLERCPLCGEGLEHELYGHLPRCPERGLGLGLDDAPEARGR